MGNIGMKIQHDTRDLILNEATGDWEFEEDYATIAQCVKATLQVYKKEWFLDWEHGTDYENILGIKPMPDDRTIQRILREAIYQEENIRYVKKLEYELDQKNRKLSVSFDAVMNDGQEFSIIVGV